jgi:hypothetical protein
VQTFAFRLAFAFLKSLVAVQKLCLPFFSISEGRLLVYTSIQMNYTVQPKKPLIPKSCASASSATPAKWTNLLNYNSFDLFRLLLCLAHFSLSVA